MNLYSLGLNVFPMPYGQKSGYTWRMLQYVRLNPEDIYPLFEGRCNTAIMTGRTSGNLFVLDCETDKQFKIHETRLRDAGIPIWAVKSGGVGGGGHFYLKCKDGEVKGVRAGQRTDYEVRGNRCYVLAPTSLHPETRRLYQWHERETVEPPTVSLSQVAWLALSLTKDSPKDIAPKPFMELSANTRQFILTGAIEGERNNRLFASACDMAGNGYSEHSTQQLLESVAISSGLSQKEVWDTIHSAYSQPRTPSKPNSQKKSKATTHELANAFANSYKWTGRTGQYDRAVFLACCQRAITANEKGVFRASSREMAELSRVSRKTASRALQRLIDAKLLVYCGQDRLSHANLYRFGHQVLIVKNSRSYPTISLPGGKDSGVLSGKTDAVEIGALGKTAFTLYSSMIKQSSPKTIKEFSTLSGLSVKQIYRAMKRLREFGLVSKFKSRYSAIALSDNQLDEHVAKPAGVYGKGQERVELHKRERAKKAAEKLYRARWHEQNYKVRSISVWVCGNCGQQWSLAGFDPPLTCDYCGDVTTWKRK